MNRLNNINTLNSVIVIDPKVTPGVQFDNKNKLEGDEFWIVCTTWPMTRLDDSGKILCLTKHHCWYPLRKQHWYHGWYDYIQERLGARTTDQEREVIDALQGAENGSFFRGKVTKVLTKINKCPILKLEIPGYHNLALAYDRYPKITQSFPNCGQGVYLWSEQSYLFSLVRDWGG